MHPHIAKLYSIADKPERLIVGLMSGTSLDGLDIALCQTIGSGRATSIELLNFQTIPYTDEYRERVLSVFSKRNVDLQTVCLLNAWIGLEHSRMILASLQQWGVSAENVDLIASHGQTIYHAPRHLHNQEQYPNATLQIGDGDHISHSTGIITCSDFRQKHIAAGGEGAPLAVFGDFLIFGSNDENRILLNIGGIANLTWLPRSADPVGVISTDIGSGNTLMDVFVQRHYAGMRYDSDSLLARKGTVSSALLAALKSDEFFDLPLPKTIGPELFNLNYLEAAVTASNTKDLTLEDQLATLNRFSADTIVDAIKLTTKDATSFALYASGGGIHNGLLTENICEQLPKVTMRSTQDLGIDPDAKEAVVFAVLANECLAGRPCRVGHQHSGIRPVTMGKISFPD